MFAPLNSETSRQRRMLTLSLALHGVLFAWLFHSPEPQLLMPSSVAIGHNGKVVARLYFPTQSPDDSSTSSSDSATQVYRRQRLGHDKLIWKQKPTAAKLPPPAQVSLAGAQDSAKTPTL